MTPAELRPLAAAALNLVVNAVPSFLVALGLVLCAVWGLRLGRGPLRLGFYSLPFVKLAWDLGRGIPEHSFLWAHVAGVTRESGSLMVGVGPAAPLGLDLRAVMTANTASAQYGLSLGDLAVLGTDRVAPWLGPVLVASVLATSLLLLGRRVGAALRFGRVRGWLEVEGTRWCHRQVGRRVVDVYVAPPASRWPDAERVGVPFASGLLRPFVCFPREAFDAMTELEREAALEHELAHVAQQHLWLHALVGATSAALWFVPASGWLARRIYDECEHLADDAAIARGVEPVALASALVRMSELLAQGPASRAHRRRVDVRPAAALASKRSGLRARVGRLLDGSSGAVPSRRAWVIGALGFAATLQTVLALVVGTNG